MELPPALAPWGPLLRIFPPDLALSLGPPLQRLASAVGPLRSRERAGDGEVDGFDGLSRRGSYERLLVSEWLLAEEAPEEFLRRAAGGEHTFLRLARPEPMGSRRSVALFDAGPGQLGSPRIAQIAALIVLARRAEAAGAPFGWGVLQRPDVPLQAGWEPAGVLRLLRSRTPWEPTDSHLDAWRERLSGWKDLDDAWIVSSPGVTARPLLQGISRLEIRDVLEPGVRRLAVVLYRGARREGELALDLPAEPDCVRLLRDPFGTEVAAPAGLPAALRPSSNLLFSPNGRHLLARTRGGGLLVLPVPNSPRAARKPPELHFPNVPGAVLVAAGGESRRISALMHGTAGLVLGTSSPGDPDLLGQLYVTGAQGQPPFQIPPATTLNPLFRLQEKVFVLDAAGNLFQLAEPPPAHHARIVQRGVLAAVVRDSRIVLAMKLPDGSLRFMAVWSDGEIKALEAHRNLRPDEAFFGTGSSGSGFGLAAVRCGNEWTLFHHGKTRLRALSGSRAVGVVSESRDRGEGLMLLNADDRTLGLAGRNWSRPLLVASGPIEHLAVSTASPQFAYATADGEVTIASTETGAVAARWLPEAP
jgi:hypothetical protein